MSSLPSQGRFAEARANLVENQLRPEGIIEPALLAAIGSIERERFVPEGMAELAYSDRVIPLTGGRELLSASSLAQLIQALEPRPGERILIVGAATGYAAAILSHMGLAVTALESDASLASIDAGNRLEVVQGPLQAGYEAGSPYDLVLIDGAVEGEVPHAIVGQLRDGGRLATGLVDRGVSRLALGTRVGTAFGLRPFADAAVTVLPGFARARSFVF